MRKSILILAAMLSFQVNAKEIKFEDNIECTTAVSLIRQKSKDVSSYFINARLSSVYISYDTKKVYVVDYNSCSTYGKNSIEVHDEQYLIQLKEEQKRYEEEQTRRNNNLEKKLGL